mmetsp:Transcript_24804/g.66087  ORF Transcript_24804/g.66087 Transcript_24804/m.66087 type:complete len:134 (+) Transcript_24804:13-414(+)
MCARAGEALTTSRVTDRAAASLVSFGSHAGPFGLLLTVYLATACLSTLVGSKATVIVLYSVVRQIAEAEVPRGQLVVTLLVGASSNFMTPFGYQTNLMVWRPGGYAFEDFSRFGAPLTLVVGLVTCLLCRVLA